MPLTKTWLSSMPGIVALVTAAALVAAIVLSAESSHANKPTMGRLSVDARTGFKAFLTDYIAHGSYPDSAGSTSRVPLKSSNQNVIGYYANAIGTSFCVVVTNPKAPGLTVRLFSGNTATHTAGDPRPMAATCSSIAGLKAEGTFDSHGFVGQRAAR